MVLMVANSLIQWTLLGGLLGPWVFLVMAVNFLCNFTTVKCFYKSKIQVNDEESGQEMMKLVNKGELTSETVDSRQKGFFPLKSSFTALWLPAVVGDQECVFLSTVISTLVT